MVSPPYEIPVLIRFQPAAAFIGRGTLLCNNGPQNMNETCNTGSAPQMFCQNGCAATVLCYQGGDNMGMCNATQCCNGGLPAPPMDQCISGVKARWDCRSGGIFDQPAFSCTSNCVDTINCTNGS
jgi:hypothetical protein